MGRDHADARQALAEADIKDLKVEEISPKNFVVKVTAGNHTAELPVNKSVLILDGQRIDLEGGAVTAPPLAPQTEPRVFLPQQAVQRILGRSNPLRQVQVP